MNGFYNLDGIKTELAKSLEEAKAKKEAWEKVTFITKKDGKPFSILGKNIVGAKIYTKPYNMQAGENTLKVYSYSNYTYIDDEIDIYTLVKYLKNEKQIAKTQNYMPKESYLEQVYTFDLDDIKEAVQERIFYFEKRITSLEKQIEKAETVYNAFKTEFSNAMNELLANCDTEDPGYSANKNDLFYAVKDTIIERFPYC